MFFTFSTFDLYRYYNNSERLLKADHAAGLFLWNGTSSDLCNAP